MSFQNVFVLGATGNVGVSLIEQISQYDMSDHGHRNPTRIVGIANSKKYILSSSGLVIPQNISSNNILDIISNNTNGHEYISHDEILLAIQKAGLEGEIIFVDVTADGEKMIKLHTKIIQDTTNRIVTANKKPAASDMKTFEILTGNQHRYRYNTTVMAGAGAVPYFQEAHGLSENIESLEGTFSGTLAFVCSELEKGERKFSEIVREAKEKGYTEPHPIDDLNGEDVRRKLLILLRSSGIHIEENEVQLKGMVDPKKYIQMSSDDFLENIKTEDDEIKDMLQSNISRGLVPRYVASYKKYNGKMVASVGLQFVSKDSELGNTKGTANKVLIHTSQRTPIDSAPHIIQSPGAGVQKTAASVRADLLYLLNGTSLFTHN